MIDREETRGFHPISAVRSLVEKMQHDLGESKISFEEGLAGNRDGKEPKPVRKPSLYNSDNYFLDLQPQADQVELTDSLLKLGRERPHSIERPIYWR